MNRAAHIAVDLSKISFIDPETRFGVALATISRMLMARPQLQKHAAALFIAAQPKWNSARAGGRKGSFFVYDDGTLFGKPVYLTYDEALSPHEYLRMNRDYELTAFTRRTKHGFRRYYPRANELRPAIFPALACWMSAHRPKVRKNATFKHMSPGHAQHRSMG